MIVSMTAITLHGIQKYDGLAKSTHSMEHMKRLHPARCHKARCVFFCVFTIK